MTNLPRGNKGSAENDRGGSGNNRQEKDFLVEQEEDKDKKSKEDQLLPKKKKEKDQLRPEKEGEEEEDELESEEETFAATRKQGQGPNLNIIEGHSTNLSCSQILFTAFFLLEAFFWKNDLFERVLQHVGCWEIEGSSEAERGSGMFFMFCGASDT